MADTLVERRPSARFFCHRCNVEFEDVLQEYVCPYCDSGFIERLESEEGSVHSSDREEISDTDMSLMDDGDDMPQAGGHPVLNDLEFLMSGGRAGGGRPDSLLEQVEHLMWTIAGPGTRGSRAIVAGTPFVLVGAPGDYVFGGEGLDAVVTHLLGQLDNAGPPPLAREQIAAIPSERITEAQALENLSCSVCWDNFQLGEQVSKLVCEHVFHTSCIEPWLQLHATCPICRRPLGPPLPPAPAPRPPAPPPHLPAAQEPPPPPQDSPTAVPRVLLRRLPRGLVTGLLSHTWGSQPTSTSTSSGTVSTGSSVTTGGAWAPNTTSTNSNSTSSLNSNNEHDRDRDRTSSYSMDIDFD